MYFEHQHFLVILTPKSASTTVMSWCLANGLEKIVDDTPVDKPVFSIFRNHRDRIISGIAEDLFYLTHQKNPNLQSLSDSEKKQLCLVDIENWAKDPSRPITQEGHHYENLSGYLPKNVESIQKVNWIKFEDLLSIDKIITKTLGIENTLIPLTSEHFQIWDLRPSKEWYFYHMSKFPSVCSWLENHINSQTKVETIQ